jgi:hypothetical protein
MGAKFCLQSLVRVWMIDRWLKHRHTTERIYERMDEQMDRKTYRLIDEQTDG